jgi:RimJ/RimL family protein N-acetyltransferase
VVLTVAVRIAAAWAFDDVGLHRIEIRHSVENAESCGVAVRAGFAYEGTAAASLLYGDGWHDMHVHARIAATDTPAERVGRPPKRSDRGSTMIGSKEEKP